MNETAPPLPETRVRELLRARGFKPSSELLPELHAKLPDDKRIVLFVSGGKDSLAAWIALRRAGFNVVPLTFYVVPGISFVETYLSYLEEHFEQSIVRLPQDNLYNKIPEGALQTMSSIWRWRTLGLPDRDITLHDIASWWLKSQGFNVATTWQATGFKLTDSYTRRLDMLRHGPLREDSRRCDVIWDLSKKNVLDLIRDEGLRLAPEYAWLNRSFEGGSPHVATHLHEHFPEDYERYKQFYPLLDVLRARQHYVAQAHAKHESWNKTALSMMDEDEEGR